MKDVARGLWVIACIGWCACDGFDSDAHQTPGDKRSDAPIPGFADLQIGHGDDGIGGEVQEGIPAILVVKDGSCAPEYVPVQGVCVNERFEKRGTPEELDRHIALFKRGATPPIISKARTAPRRDPRLLDPAALMASVEQLAKQAQAKATKLLHDERSAQARAQLEARRRAQRAAADDTAPNEPDGPTAALSPTAPATPTGQATSGELEALAKKAEATMAEHLTMLDFLKNAKQAEDLTEEDLARMHGYLERHGKRMPQLEER